MQIIKTCCYKSKRINVLPAIVITIEERGFVVAFKWLRGHLGVRIRREYYAV